MAHFEFIIDGPPISQQTRRRETLRAWIGRLTDEAKKFWPEGDSPISGLIMVRITYFYNSASIDVDNIIKPVLDALKGLVFADDDQITDVWCRKRNVNAAFRIENASDVLTEGFGRQREFLHILIQDAPDQEVL